MGCPSSSSSSSDKVAGGVGTLRSALALGVVSDIFVYCASTFVFGFLYWCGIVGSACVVCVGTRDFCSY